MQFEFNNLDFHFDYVRLLFIFQVVYFNNIVVFR
jgi:hypothetical protein